MIAQNILNLTGLIVNIVGAYLMYRNAPPVNSQTFLYRDEEMKEKIKKDKHKNKMSRYGMFLLFIGFLLQFIALLLNCLVW